MNPVITSHSPNQISLMLWGLIPRQSKSKNQFAKYSTINATKDKLTKSPFYAKPFQEYRCLIPADFFYEPDKIRFTKPPYPWYYFGLKSKESFAFAGIYEIWKDPKSGEEIYSYSLVTVDPNEVVGTVHPRMPAILKKEDEATWVNPDISEPEQLLSLLSPYPADLMEGWRVGDEAKSYKSVDGPELIKPTGPLPMSL
jgi:putative SOS response-associated peptidase YedK